MNHISQWVEGKEEPRWLYHPVVLKFDVSGLNVIEDSQERNWTLDWNKGREFVILEDIPPNRISIHKRYPPLKSHHWDSYHAAIEEAASQIKTNPARTPCPHPEKVGHATKQSAKDSAKERMEKEPGLKLWVYKCRGKYKQKNLTRSGAHWHLTSKPPWIKLGPQENPPTIYDSEGRAIQGEWWWVARHDGCKKPTKEKQKMYEWSTIPPSWWSFKHKKARE